MPASFLPRGDGAVADRLQLKGSFALWDAHFTNPKMQSRVDQLSLRGQGKADQAKQESDALHSGDLQQAAARNVPSIMKGQFLFGLQHLTLHTLDFQVPGARAVVNGTYDLQSQTLNFTGQARLQAHVSQTVTGWKSWLLKPVDPFFAHNGAGTQVPIKITGTAKSPDIGLNF